MPDGPLGRPVTLDEELPAGLHLTTTPDGTGLLSWRGYRLGTRSEGQDPPPDDDPNMGLSSVRNYHETLETPSKPRGRYGLKGIPTTAQTTVRSAGELMQQEFGMRNLTFGTATVPDLDPELNRLINSRWGEVLRRFQQKVTRKLTALGLPTDMVIVSEVQEKRLLQTGRLVLHLHWLNVGRDDTYKDHAWAIGKEWWSQAWDDTLSDVTGTPIKAPAGTRVERVKHDAAGYLAKYMSKGGKLLVKITAPQPCRIKNQATGDKWVLGRVLEHDDPEHDPDCIGAVVEWDGESRWVGPGEFEVGEWSVDELPRQWWSTTKPLKDKVKDHSYRYHLGRRCDFKYLLEKLQQLKGVRVWGCELKDGDYTELMAIKFRSRIAANRGRDLARVLAVCDRCVRSD